MAQLLVIDDDPGVCKMLQRTLEKAGYTVTTAPDGVKGLKRYREQGADLVITDLVMPEKEGIETILEIRKTAPDTKIIAMSGGGTNRPESYLEMAEALGAFRTFPKPVERDALLQAVEEALG